MVRRRGRGARARPRRPTGPATCGPGGATRTPTARASSPAATSTRCPDGGAFDGPLGVVSRRSPRSTLLRARRVHAARGRSASSCFADEEGARFGVACAGSRLITGALDADRARGLTRRRTASTMAEAHGRGRASTRRTLGRDDGDAAPDRRRSSSCTSSRAAAGRPGRAGRRRHARSGRTAAGGSTSPARPTTPAPPGSPTATTRCSASPRAVLAARAAAERHGARRHRRQGARSSPNGVNAIPSRGHGLARRPRRRRRPRCARSVAEIAARRPRAGGAGSRSRGPPPPPFDAGLRDRLRRRCSATRPLLATGAGHDAGILAAAGSRPRCCSSATRPASRTRPPSTPSEADCLAGVDALAAVLANGWPDDDLLVRARLAARRRRRRRAGRASTADGITAVDRGRPPPAGDARLPGVVLPGLRQRPLPRLPPGAARPHPRRRRHVLDLARADVRASPARLDPDSLPARWPARCTPRWRWPGSPRVGEFHYLHHGPDGTPYADPNAMGEALRRGRRATPASGSPCSTPATWPAGSTPGTLAGPGAAPVRRRHDVDALGATASPRCAPADGLRGRRGDPLGPGGARATELADGRRGARDRPPAARPPVRAAGRERRVPGGATACTPTELLADDGRARARHDRGARHPPDRRRTSRCSAAPAPASASARPPSATSPTASARPASCATPARRCRLGTDQHAVIDLLEEARALEMHERLRTGRARPVHARPSCSPR